ncbi:MAG: dihydroxy-acid dehydratase, partial [Acidimicrobiales bacterium]|nr:dihydroxy-acid dehydratase [Acidimicrobiales bacterium]
LTVELQGRGLGKDVALITDGRFSGVSHGILIGHICPEAADGGPLATVEDGDTIVIDPVSRTLDVAIDDSDLERRMATIGPRDVPDTIPQGSVLRRYARHVSSAHYGCVQ